jgi:hypothetical protein
MFPSPGGVGRELVQLTVRGPAITNMTAGESLWLWGMEIPPWFIQGCLAITWKEKKE